MNQPELKTSRLILRKFEQSDSTEVERLAGEKAVALMTLNIPHPYLPGMGSQWISTHEEGWVDKSCISFAITLGTSGQLLGAMSLIAISNSEVEMGYWIGEEYWGCGYCTEAAQVLLEFAFDELGFVRITARHLEVNPASGRVMEKCGMKFCGTSEGLNRDAKPAKFMNYELIRE